jgi:mRNA interferase RelE/StbE
LAYRVRYKQSIAKDLKSIPKRERAHILDEIEKQLVKHPEKQRQLKGRFAGLRRLRVGNYRVIYSVMDDEVWVLRIGHRGGVYR